MIVTPSKKVGLWMESEKISTPACAIKCQSPYDVLVLHLSLGTPTHIKIRQGEVYL